MRAWRVWRTWPNTPAVLRPIVVERLYAYQGSPWVASVCLLPKEVAVATLLLNDYTGVDIRNLDDTWDSPVAVAHERPTLDNMAGLWAFRESTWAAHECSYHYEGYVFGEIELAGRVVEHELGYRAEKAIVRAIVQVDYTLGTWGEVAKEALFRHREKRKRAFEGRYQCPVTRMTVDELARELAA